MRELVAGQTLRLERINVQPATRRHKARQVGRLFLPDGRDVGCEMIRRGQAEEAVRFSKGAYAECKPR